MAGLRTKLYHLGGSPKLSNNPVRITLFFCGAADDGVATNIQTTTVNNNVVTKQIDMTSFMFLIIIVKDTKSSS